MSSFVQNPKQTLQMSGQKSQTQLLSTTNDQLKFSHGEHGVISKQNPLQTPSN